MRAFYCFAGHPDDSGVVLVFSPTLGKAKGAASSLFEVEFIEVTVRSCGGYDSFAAEVEGDKAVLFLDNVECAAAGIPDYYSEEVA